MNNLKEFSFSYSQFDDDRQLSSEDRALLLQARDTAEKAYAPYSGFFVGTAALLANKAIVTATNQENASFPAGICAERVLLSAIVSQYGAMAIEALAISYINKKNGQSDHPVSPCGICRQSLMEYQNRVQQPIRLILGGIEGKVIIIEDVSFLLPFNFDGKDIL